ncbi:MAG: monofunctional biosynthetic peptidoglycan transglycosylase [Cytophagaceae bacterium]|jgi:monofunctional biosynthetic peptidoglycan transglycosylase|nr:monofunctional biosynthetic peptidoglycan transglycosylase [Cytophagaceae bacterium]
MREKLIWLLLFLRKVLIYFFVSTILVAIAYRFFNPPITYLMLQRLVEQKWKGKEMRLRKTWVKIEDQSPYLPKAVIASEDQRFVEHHGFDFESIQKAYEYNQKHKHKIGASTITQQVAKNVFLWPGRSWIRKGLEAYFTLLIELFWDKKRILEVYLNVIEMGDGIYGAEAASRAYYKRGCDKLSKQQAAGIAAILPSPLKWSASKPGPRVKSRILWISRELDQVQVPEIKKKK